MSEDAMQFLDLMHEESVCFYCGNEYIPSWNAGAGPAEEPWICSTCASKLRKRETLEAHIPQQQATGGSQNYANYGSSSASKIAFSENCMPKAVQPPFCIPNKEKRPVIEEQVLSPREKCPEQLCNDLQGLEISKGDDEDGVLIYQRINHYIPENEIGLGCMLLKPPPAIISSKESIPECPASEDSKPGSAAVTTSLTPVPKRSKTKSSTVFKSHASSSMGSKLKASTLIKSAISPMKDFKPKAQPPENNNSCLIDVPIKEASQDEILTFKCENLVDVSEKTRRDRNSYPEHHLNTRSRTYRSLKDIYGSDTPREDKVAYVQHRRLRGRSRIQKTRDKTSINSLNEIEVALLSDDAQKELKCESSGNESSNAAKP